MWHIVCTQVYKPASIQVCKFLNLQICNYVSKDTSMQSLQYASMRYRICRPFLRFLDPEIAPFLQFLDPEIFWSIFTISGSRNCSISAVSGSRNCTISTISGSRIFLVHIHNFWIQKLQYFWGFWIQKPHHFCNFWIIKWARENVPPLLLPTNGLGAADKWMMVIILGWWPQGHHPRMVTIIHLSPGSTQPAVHTIHTRLGGPSPQSFP